MSLRADGRENRRRLLDAAEAAFAEQGFDTPLEAIAKQAGVSRMTLYRHFKDREALCFAVLERNVAMLESKAEALADEPNACAAIIDMMLVMFTTNQGMVEGLTRQSAHQAQIKALRLRVVDLLSGPLARAQAAGLIRLDIQPEDLSLVMYMLGSVVGDGPLEERKARVGRALKILQFGFLRAEGADAQRGDIDAPGLEQSDG